MHLFIHEYRQERRYSRAYGGGNKWCSKPRIILIFGIATSSFVHVSLLHLMVLYYIQLWKN
jgi:hypothetical protein